MNETKTAHAAESPPELSRPAFSRMTSAQFLKDYDALHAGVKPRASGRVQHTKTPRKTLEEDLHREVFAWIFLHEKRYPILKYTMHVPNGGARSKGEAGKLKAMGVRKGVSDIINPFAQPGGKGFACELKAPGGVATPEQKDFLREASEHDWVRGVCYTLDEFVALIHVYLGVSAQRGVN